MKRSKTGFTYIETCIALIIFMMMMTPFCMAHLATIRTRVTVNRLEEMSQRLESLRSEIKKEIASFGTFSIDKLDAHYYKTDQYHYDIVCCDLEEMSSDSLLSNALVQLLDENSTLSLEDARLTLDATGLISCQTNNRLYISERAKIKVREEIVGTYLDIAKGRSYFNIEKQDTEPLVVTLDLTQIKTPFTVKIANATTKPLIIQTKGDTTAIHFILDDPNGQTTFVQDQKQSVTSHYKIIQIQISDPLSENKVVAQTLFFQPYEIREEDKNER